MIIRMNKCTIIISFVLLISFVCYKTKNNIYNDLINNNENIDNLNQVTLTGIQFNKLMKKMTFVRLTNKNEIHRTIHYVTGENIDIVPFNSTNEKSGLYFIELEQMYNWLNYSPDIGEMYWIRKVTIPNDALIYVEKNKFKTNKFILSERIKITVS